MSKSDYVSSVVTEKSSIFITNKVISFDMRNCYRKTGLALKLAVKDNIIILELDLKILSLNIVIYTMNIGK